MSEISIPELIQNYGHFKAQLELADRLADDCERLLYALPPDVKWSSTGYIPVDSLHRYRKSRAKNRLTSSRSQPVEGTI